MANTLLDQLKEITDNAYAAAGIGGKAVGLAPDAKITMDNLSDEVLALIRSNASAVVLEIPNWGVRSNVAGASKIPNYAKMLDDLTMGNNIFLYGEAGNGKTTVAKALASSLGVEYISINCNQWTAPAEIIGGQTIDGYVQGKLIHAWTKGAMLLIDELPKLDPNTAGVLNEALALAGEDDPRKAVIIDGKGDKHTKHPKFMVVATGNTTGVSTSLQYPANNQQDASMIDRFRGSYYYVPFPDELAKSILFTPVYTIFMEIRNVIIQKELGEPTSLRVMINANKAYHLEMMRLTGENTTSLIGGKTLIDSIESYLAIMDEDAAAEIKSNVNLTDFYGNYKNVDSYKNDLKRMYQA